MTHYCDQFAVAATTSRLWRPGDIIYSGQLIGATIYDDLPIRAQRTVRVTSIQYDIDSAAVILQVEPVVETTPYPKGPLPIPLRLGISQGSFSSLPHRNGTQTLIVEKEGR
ncbi:MAG TPA: hypothetical protein VMW65_06035 [Chloroflexota bacterium]|nr:hypothetical protein [Chloroflexota bacterium]